MSFLVPKIPNVATPVSPLNSATAEQARQKAADDAERDASKYGRASTIQAGNDIAYGGRGSSGAGTSLTASPAPAKPAADATGVALGGTLKVKRGASQSMGY